MRQMMTAMTGALLLAVSPVAAQPAMRHVATVVAATWEDGSLLLRADADFSILVIGAETVVRDVSGRVAKLGHLRPGDRVEYSNERWAGMAIASDVRVVTAAAAARGR